MTTAIVNQYLKTNNMIIPPEGPVIIPVDLDFSAENEIILETELLFSSGKVSLLQGVFIDNYDNPEPLVLFNQTSRQRIVAPSNSQGYYDIFLPKPSTIKCNTVSAVNLKIKVTFYNVPIASGVWKNSDGGGGSGDCLTNVELRATPVIIENTQVDLIDLSIDALSGISELLDAARIRETIIISNVGNSDIAFNFLGEPAIINGAGSITLASGGTMLIDKFCSKYDINIIGTAGQKVTAIVGIYSGGR